MILRQGTFLLDRYEIIDQIGAGGMSEVYKALDTKLNRMVAIKVLKEEFCKDPSFVEKFKMEAQAAAGLTHPNVVNVYDVIDEDGLHYIVMELVEGITLKDFITKKGRLSVREALGIAIQIAQGIGAAHDQNIVHRDVKPQNVIISADGKVKVADFGIARAASGETLTQAAMGSVHYISPEQAKGESGDKRSDIYSLGISLYEMLTGATPFNGDTSVAVALAQIENEMPLAGNYNPEVPQEVDRIILKCCQKKPERRYQNTGDLISDLRYALSLLSMEKPNVQDLQDQHTRVLTPQEMGEINARAKAKAAMPGRERIPEIIPETPRKQEMPPERNKIITSKSEKSSGLDKVITIVGILLAIVLVAAAVIVVGRMTGLFGKEETPQQTEAVETTKGDLTEQQTYCPDVSDLSLELAEKKLTESSLQIKVQYQDSDTVEKNMVISQDPLANTIVDKYSTVKVVISNGSNSEDLTPLNLFGMMYEDARGILLEKGYDVKMQETFNDEYEAGRVISVNPINPERNGEVILIVSKGQEQMMTKVPSIIGQTEDVAIALLAESKLMPGEVTQAPSDTVPAGTVLSQAILADTDISVGATIGYTVSSGPELPQVKYYGSLQTTYSLANLIGPGMGDANVNIMIRLHQVVNGEDVYTTLMEPTTIRGNTSLPIKYDYIEGADGVDSGEVEIVRADDDTVLKSYDIQFFAQQQ